MYIAYEQATKYFFTCVAQVTDLNIDNKHPDGWSARQVIHHMADSETQSYARLRRLLAEPEGSIIQGYDEAAWAGCKSLGYEELPIQPSLDVIKSVREASRVILERLSENDLNRFGTHTESGKYTLADWLRIYTDHPHDHGDQLLRALESRA